MKIKVLEVRLTEYEEKKVKQEAAKRGTTKSELIRSFIAKLPEPVAE